MDRLDTIKMFVRVVENGSFSAVARELGVGQPTVSKEIASLESYLGAQLLLRTSRRVTLTDAGREFFDSASKLPISALMLISTRWALPSSRHLLSSDSSQPPYL